VDLTRRRHAVRTLAPALTLAGGLLLLVSGFLPQASSVTAPLRSSAATADNLLEEGIGWMLAAGALLLLALTLRARRRGDAPTWAGLWIGLLALFNGLFLARDESYRPVEGGVVALGLAGALVLAGWVAGFAASPTHVAGLGQWRSLPATLRAAGTARLVPRLRRGAALWALALFALASALLFGVPVLGGFRSTLIAQNSIDPSVYTWFYGWWPHAVTSASNPFITDVIFVPEGYNLTWVTSVPGPSLLMGPVTVALGPVATYNLLALAAAPLAAWSAFLLCRHVSGNIPASLLGGFLFGFSPYMLRMLQGSPHLYFVAFVPLVALLVLRRLQGSLSERTLYLSLTAIVVVQYLTSNDVLATTTVFGALALAAAFALYVELRAAILRTAAVIAAAYLSAVVLLTPVLFFMLFREHTTPEQNTPFFANDLVSWFFPDSSMLLAKSHAPGGTDPHFGGLAYFTIPLLVLVAVYCTRNRRSRQAQLLGLCFALPTVAGLGHRLTVDGDITRIGLPWSAVDHLPGLELLVPQRFPLYAFLAAAVISSLWLAVRGSGVMRWALALAAVALMLPWVGGSYWKTPLSTPEFFAAGIYRDYLDEDDHVLTIPIIGDSMRWQSEEKFDFELAGGGVGAFPESYTRYPIFGTFISGGPLPPNYAAELRRFVRDKGISAVVVDKTALNPERERLFASLGVDPLDTGGVMLYRLGRSGRSLHRTSVASVHRPSAAVSFFPSSEVRAR
jgi:hypothetical protein